MEKQNKIHLIMPMGGAGTRFFNDGIVIPKPMIEIHQRPFFYWATQSIKKYIDIADLTFVVLRQHIADFKIDQLIHRYYSDAKIVVIPEVLPGAVMTCLAGTEEITDDQPILFNDCDHMFVCSAFNREMNRGTWDYDGALLTFVSDKPQFSYIKFDGSKIVGTLEKQVVSNQAICGAYAVRNAALFRAMAEKYLKECSYHEYFLSGIYNVMCQEHLQVKNYAVDFHVSFGTPAEYEAAKQSDRFAVLEEKDRAKEAYL